MDYLKRYKLEFFRRMGKNPKNQELKDFDFSKVVLASTNDAPLTFALSHYPFCYYETVRDKNNS